jgi:hypothetical protein
LTHVSGAVRAGRPDQPKITDVPPEQRKQDGTKTMENLLGAKSLDKAFEVQTEYAKAAYENYVSEVTKLGELYSDLAGEAFKPYQSFVAKVTPTK